MCTVHTVHDSIRSFYCHHRPHCGRPCPRHPCRRGHRRYFPRLLLVLVVTAVTRSAISVDASCSRLHRGRVVAVVCRVVLLSQEFVGGHASGIGWSSQWSWMSVDCVVAVCVFEWQVAVRRGTRLELKLMLLWLLPLSIAPVKVVVSIKCS